LVTEQAVANHHDVAMNDETAENREEERKGEPVKQMIDTSDKPKRPQAAQPQLSQQAMYDFYEPIEKAYEWNSSRLLEMIMGEC